MVVGHAGFLACFGLPTYLLFIGYVESSSFKKHVKTHAKSETESSTSENSAEAPAAKEACLEHQTVTVTEDLPDAQNQGKSCALSLAEVFKPIIYF